MENSTKIKDKDFFKKFNPASSYMAPAATFVNKLKKTQFYKKYIRPNIYNDIDAAEKLGNDEKEKLIKSSVEEIP